ncbi:Hypothetical protein C900_05946 [Fulvivirga imtechensis AK7]|uniref:SAM-dependent methyltransferase n=1 Tax=Fulvivirga imtechensis AK7 TaxID=1237149 RepID=L8JKB5_9BACT|nr:class I SAM-dependent methyltransferase [Fulvivirga imtechensis]ELR68683.1 Hypothetical protein C900_05946 [Fulvivirga imtechensis AK7]
MSKLHQISSYIEYWLNAVDQHSLHAPFVYELYTKVVKNSEDATTYRHIEALREKFVHSSKNIQLEDFGAGSAVTKNNIRQISNIATYGVTQPRYAQLIHRISCFLEVKHAVELGTALGINTLYMASKRDAQVHTFEGSSQLCGIAREVFAGEGMTNIHLIEGNIDDTLPEFIMRSPAIDLAFIDANHRFIPTINYFELLIKKAHKASCFIFDDIHWSKEMEKAWKHIIQHYSVTLSLDLYQLGLVFFNPELRKQHYVLQF